MKINTYVEFLWNKKRQIYEEVYSEFEEYNGEAALCKGGGGGDQRTEIRYAPYIEAHHADFLDVVQSSRKAVINDSPFASYTDIEVDDAFFGAGYLISSFPSLYDMYGKFMAGFDVETLWGNLARDVLNKSESDTAIAAEMKIINEQTDVKLAGFQIEMRNLNAVASSSFVIGKAVIEDERVKALSRISGNAKFQLIPNIQNRFNAVLNWNKETIRIYAETMKSYFMTKTDVDEGNYTFDVRDKLWPFTVLDFERAALGALQGATHQKTMAPRERSMISKVLLVSSYTVMGAYIGSATPGMGIVIGGVIGFFVGLAMIFLE